MIHHFRKVLTPPELYLMHEAFGAGVNAAFLGNHHEPILALEKWLSDSVTENGEFQVCDVLASEAASLIVVPDIETQRSEFEKDYAKVSSVSRLYTFARGFGGLYCPSIEMIFKLWQIAKGYCQK